MPVRILSMMDKYSPQRRRESAEGAEEESSVSAISASPLRLCGESSPISRLSANAWLCRHSPLATRHLSSKLRNQEQPSVSWLRCWWACAAGSRWADAGHAQPPTFVLVPSKEGGDICRGQNRGAFQPACGHSGHQQRAGGQRGRHARHLLVDGQSGRRQQRRQHRGLRRQYHDCCLRPRASPSPIRPSCR